MKKVLGVLIAIMMMAVIAMIAGAAMILGRRNEEKETSRH